MGPFTAAAVFQFRLLPRARAVCHSDVIKTIMSPVQWFVWRSYHEDNFEQLSTQQRNHSKDLCTICIALRRSNLAVPRVRIGGARRRRSIKRDYQTILSAIYETDMFAVVGRKEGRKVTCSFMPLSASQTHTQGERERETGPRAAGPGPSIKASFIGKDRARAG